MRFALFIGFCVVALGVFVTLLVMVWRQHHQSRSLKKEFMWNVIPLLIVALLLVPTVHVVFVHHKGVKTWPLKK